MQEKPHQESPNDDHFFLRRATVATFFVACLLTLSGASGCSAQSTPASTKIVKRGESLPIYVSPTALTEAKDPTVDLLSSYGFQHPGPEKYYGYALRDLSNYLQKMTGAQFPLSASDAKASSGIFAGTFAEFPNFKPQQEKARQAMASADPEAFVVQAQGEKLFVLGKTQFGLIAAIYSLLDKLGMKWFAPGEK